MTDSRGTKNRPKRAILHCAATPDFGDKFGAKDIDKWHRERGWKGCGYHWVLRRSGIWELGRPIELYGAHCRLGGNIDTVGLCYMGTHHPAPEQLEALVAKARELKTQFGIEVDDWFGHYEIDGRKPRCPGFDMELFRAFLRARI